MTGGGPARGRVTGGDIGEQGGGRAPALVRTRAVILREPLTRAVTGFDLQFEMIILV